MCYSLSLRREENDLRLHKNKLQTNLHTVPYDGVDLTDRLLSQI